MKQLRIFTLTLLLLGTLSAMAGTTRKIEVYYFHYTRRCITCKAVETETVKALGILYPQAVKSGKIVFRSMNLDESASQTLAEKYQIGGQTLLVVSGDKKTDLTNEAFMNAVHHPETWQLKLKQTLTPLLQ